MKAIESQKRRQMCVDRCTLQLDDNEKEAISLFKDHDLLEQWRAKFQKIKRKIHKVDAAPIMKNYMVNMFGTETCNDLRKELIQKAQRVSLRATRNGR